MTNDDFKVNDIVTNVTKHASIKVRDRVAINKRKMESNGHLVVSKITNEPVYIKGLKPVKPKQRDDIVKLYKGKDCIMMNNGTPCSIENCTLEKCSRAVEKFKSVMPEQPLPPKHKVFAELGYEGYNAMMKREAKEIKVDRRSSGYGITIDEGNKRSNTSSSFFSDVERNEINSAIEANISGSNDTAKQITYPIDIDVSDEDI